jgi:hypothetical protein
MKESEIDNYRREQKTDKLKFRSNTKASTTFDIDFQ